MVVFALIALASSVIVLSPGLIRGDRSPGDADIQVKTNHQSAVRALTSEYGGPGALAPTLAQVNAEFVVTVSDLDGAEIVVEPLEGPCRLQRANPPTFLAQVTGTCTLVARTHLATGEIVGAGRELHVLIARPRGELTTAATALFGEGFTVVEVLSGGPADATLVSGMCRRQRSSPTRFLALGDLCTFEVIQVRGDDTTGQRIEVQVEILAALPM